MVKGCAPLFEDPHPSPRIGHRRSQHVHELPLPDMKRAGTSNQNAAGPKHLQGTEVEFLVATDGGFQNSLGLSEGRRVEHDGVVLLTCRRVILQQVEGVGLDPFDLAAGVLITVESFVLLGHFKRRTEESTAVTLLHTRTRCSAKPP